MYNTSSYYYAAPQANAGLTIFAAVLLFITVMTLAVFLMIAWGKLFKKAGQPWERLFVPFYNTYWMYKLALCTKFFWTFVIGIAVMPLVAVVAVLAEAPALAGLFISIFSLVIAIMGIIYIFRLAKAYGKGTGFGFGLLFLYPIFILILGFGQSEYQYHDKLTK